MAKQELTQTFRTEGAEKSAQQVNAFQQSLENLRTESEKLANLKGDPGATVEQIKAQAVAVNQAKKAYSELGGEISDTTFNSDAFAAVLSRIHPALGGLVTGVRDAARSLGDLGTKQFSVTQLFAAGKKGVAEYGSTLALLGAGGAALLALSALAKAYAQVAEEAKKAKEASQEFNEENRRLIDQAREFDRLRLNAIESGAVPTGQSEGDRKAQRSSFRQLQNRFGLSSERAFGIATGQEAPLTPEQELELSVRGITNRRSVAREDLNRGTLSTDSLDFVSEITGMSQEKIKRLLAENKRVGESGGIAGVRDFTFGEAPISAFLNAISGSLRLGNIGEAGGIGSPGGIGGVETNESAELRRLMTVLGEAARDLKQAATSLNRSGQATTSAMDSVARKTPRTAVPGRMNVGLG